MYCSMNRIGTLLAGEKKMVDVKEIAAKFTTDVVASTAYGLNVNSLNNPDAEFRKYGKMVFDYSFMRGFEILAMFFLPNLVRFTGMTMFGKETTSFLRKAFWDTINQRMESGQKRNDLIDILIELKRTHGDQDVGGFSKQNSDN